MAEKRRRAGQPAFTPTDRQRGMVAGMALWNVPQEQIRQRILKPNGKPISINTLKKAFKKELMEGFTDVESNLATAMYKRGLKDNGFQDGRFLLKCKFGWNEDTKPTEGEWTIVGGLPPFLDSELSAEDPPEEEAVEEAVPEESNA